MTEALCALAALLEAPCHEHAAIAAALELPPVPMADEYTSVVVFQAYPYASVYLGAEGMLGGEARDRIAGFWRALGLEPPAEPDHLTVLVAGLAALGDSQAVRGALLWEHVASWMPPYLAALARLGAPFYVKWAELLQALLVELAAELGPPARLPLALRAAPAVPDAPGDLEELLATLLAPARTGFVLVRDDLERAATELGLGLRAGERRFALRALLAQDPPGVLGWLADESRAQARNLPALAPITSWWAARAQASASWLDELAASAHGGECAAVASR